MSIFFDRVIQFINYSFYHRDFPRVQIENRGFLEFKMLQYTKDIGK